MPEVTQFLVPDELGWEANDKLRYELYDFLHKAKQLRKGTEDDYYYPLLKVLAAETMDNMYAKIKEYQKENNNG